MPSKLQSSLQSNDVVGVISNIGLVEDIDRPGHNNLGNGGGTYFISTTERATTRVNGQAGDDYIDIDGPGNSVVHGGSGNDQIAGSWARDQLFGDSGNDRLAGGGGNDILNGGSGDDVLLGGTGNDVLIGGSGNDRLIGGVGADMLTGGAGADTFRFASDTAIDQITDFARGEDRIDLSGLTAFGFTFNSPNFVQWPNVSVISMADGQHVHAIWSGGEFEVVVQTTDGSLLTADDFILQ